MSVAIVTGGSRGIGRATALRLAMDGVAVAVNYRENEAAATETAELILRSGGRAIAVQGDVGDPSCGPRMVAEVENRLGPVTILVNNAGVLKRGDLGDFDFSQMEPMRRINVDGLVHMTRAVVPGMQAAGYGRIVNLASIAAFGTAMAGTTFYAATKAAVMVLTKRFAMELGPRGITVNAVAPGFIATDMVFSGRTQAEGEELLRTMANKAMVRRVGTPEDIADVVAFLAGDRAGFITGQVMAVDGGRMDYLAP
ncbi:MAG: SDR family oxidoreductase [Acidobacteria bacterium]|nr:SDR family oxidoreductase [Acidobacteriota bacterium]